jgi:hypothetical protein
MFRNYGGTTEYMRITATGLVGVGSTTPWGKLSVEMDTTNPAFVVANQGSSSPSFYISGVNQNGYVGIGTTTPNAPFTIDNNGINASTTNQTINGISQYMRMDPNIGVTQFGNFMYITYAPTSTASTMVGNMIKVEDNSLSTSTVRGLEVQAHRGTNTLGENTAISAFGRTFGVRAVTVGDAGGSFAPAAIYAETRGTTQGTALRGYSNTLTTGDLVSLFTDTSNFSGNGLVMNFGNTGTAAGSFIGNFLNLKNIGTTKFIVTQTGQTGIGTSTPWAQFSVTASSTSATDYAVVIANSANTPLFVIQNAGNVGIGTSSPDMLLSVGSSVPTGDVAHFENSTGSCYINPTTTALVCNSDARLKTNVNDLADSFGLDALMKLQPVTFNWIRGEATGTPTHTGFIAQEVMQIMPDLVTQAPDGFYSMSYSGLTPYLVKGLQELNIKIDTVASTTASSTPASQAFADSFWSNAFSRITSWLGDAGNGIANIFATTITAVNVNTENLITKKLCLSDDSGETCVTKSQLDALLSGVGASTPSGSTGGSVGVGSSSTGGSTPPPDSGSSVLPADSSSSTPTTDSGTSTPQAPPLATDTEAPTLTLLGTSPESVDVGTLYIDSGATVADNVDQNLTYTIAVDGGVPAASELGATVTILDTSTPGTHTLTYASTDAAGNMGTASRTVEVVASAVPTPEPTPAPTEESSEPAPTPEPAPTEPAPEPVVTAPAP